MRFTGQIFFKIPGLFQDFSKQSRNPRAFQEPYFSLPATRQLFMMEGKEQNVTVTTITEIAQVFCYFKLKSDNGKEVKLTAG